MSTPANPARAVEFALNVIGGKWKVLIAWHLHDTPKRYGELRRLIPGVTEKMLIRQLRELESDGIITRTDHHTVPPHVQLMLATLSRMRSATATASANGVPGNHTANSSPPMRATRSRSRT